MIRAGTPTTVTWAGTSLVTTAPAPITDHSPIWTSLITVAPAPMKQPSLSVTPPQIDTPGLTLTNEAIAQSCEIELFVLRILCWPIVVCVVMTAPGATQVPGPILTVSPTM